MPKRIDVENLNFAARLHENHCVGIIRQSLEIAIALFRWTHFSARRVNLAQLIWLCLRGVPLSLRSAGWHKRIEVLSPMVAR